MTDEDALKQLKQLKQLFPDRTFEIRRTDRVRVYMNGKPATVRDKIEQCVAVVRFYANWLAKKPTALAELKEELARIG